MKVLSVTFSVVEIGLDKVCARTGEVMSIPAAVASAATRSDEAIRMWVLSRGAQLRRKELLRGASRCRGAPGAIPRVPTLHASQHSHSALEASEFTQPSRATFSNHAGGRGCAVRPPDDPLELAPDDDDPDEPDDPDDDPESPDRDDDAPLVVPLDEPDV